MSDQEKHLKRQLATEKSYLSQKILKLKKQIDKDKNLQATAEKIESQHLLEQKMQIGHYIRFEQGSENDLKNNEQKLKDSKIQSERDSLVSMIKFDKKNIHDLWRKIKIGTKLLQRQRIVDMKKTNELRHDVKNLEREVVGLEQRVDE